MKKLFLPILLIIAVTSAYGAPFQPTKLVLTAPSTIQYQFDESVLQIPLTVTGKPSFTMFMVYAN